MLYPPYLTCSEKFCDNLLVYADVLTILGVSFCVIQNTLNFIKPKKCIFAQFNGSYIPLCSNFFIFVVLRFVCIAQYFVSL